MAFAIREIVTVAAVDDAATSEIVRTRDGARLATDVYLPSGPGRHPAILVRTPYDKSSRYTGLAQMGKLFAERGYAFVAQDCRGKFRSEGETIPYAYDVTDSYDTVDWIISQPWCNGRVGLLGASYWGYTVWAGIASGHPAIMAAIPQVTAVDMADPHMASRWRQVVPNLWGADDLVQMWSDRNIYFVSIDYRTRPVAEAFAEASDAIGVPCQAVSTLIDKAKTGDTVNPYGMRHPYYTANIPILHWVHWFDIVLGGPLGMADYRYFRRLPGMRDLHFLRANSADHEGFLLEKLAERHHINPEEAVLEARARDVQFEADFFDPFLREVGKPPSPRNRVSWHLGQAGWLTSPDWPPHGAEAVRFYLSPTESGGVLSSNPIARRIPLRWIHDPESPVPSSTTHDEIWTFLLSYPDEQDYLEREGVLSFTSEPMPGPLDIAGPIDVFVAVGSTAPSMHVFAKLFDVDPEGAASPISRGQVVVYDPDPERLVQVDLYEMAYRIRPGHRLRVQLSSSDYPLWLVHPGTDANPWFAGKLMQNEQVLMTGGSFPSHIRLFVLPESQYPSKRA